MFAVNMGLWFHNKLSLTEVEGLIPWERDAYVALITDYIEKVEQERRTKETK